MRINATVGLAASLFNPHGIELERHPEMSNAKHEAAAFVGRR